jgi:NADH dehydrogenase [ubiquinone] 1 alpha subcomplex assembly factor 5
MGTSIEVNEQSAPEIFCNRRRTAYRNRAGYRITARGCVADLFLWQHIADELRERLMAVSRDFEHILIIGPLANWAQYIIADRSATVTCAALCDAERSKDALLFDSEDRLPIANESYDVIITAGTIDSVNDLPGSLIQMRRSLRPDGLLLATLFGAGTLSALKSAMMSAAPDMVQPHIHPQIDIRQAADLLQRTGFTIPVADVDNVDIAYRDWRRLVDDLRDMGVGNALMGDRRYLGRGFAAQLDKAWHAMADDNGRVRERFSLLHLSGWSPSPDQPKPAQRGSATMSLAAALRAKPL